MTIDYLLRCVIRFAHRSYEVVHMQFVATQDPCFLGPDVAGMLPPDFVYAIMCDMEQSANEAQIAMAFEAGACDGDFVVMDRHSASSLFIRLQVGLALVGEDIGDEAAGALLAVWKLPGNLVALLAADVYGGFSRCALRRALADTQFKPISRMCFDARLLKNDMSIPEGTRGILQLLANPIASAET